MNRRTFLGALAAGSGGATAGLAGCLGPFGAARGADDAGEPGPTGDPPEGAQRHVRLLEADDAGRNHDVEIVVEVLDPWVTDDAPARLRVTTTNEGERRAISVADGQCSLFNREGGASEPRGVWLHRAESADHVDHEPRRWSRDAPADEERAYLMYGCLPRTYESGERVATEYVLWDDYRVDGYYPTGTYRFAERVTVHPPEDGTGGDDEPLAAFDWGFSVRVRRP